MENVKGFDQDEARNCFVKMLESENYYFQVAFYLMDFLILQKLMKYLKGVSFVSNSIWNTQLEA